MCGGRVTSKVSSNHASASRKRSSSIGLNDELRHHYDFDYSKARPNRFAARFSEETVAVVLDPDVATVFHSSEAVNAFLRSAISAMPRSKPRKRQRGFDWEAMNGLHEKGFISDPVGKAKSVLFTEEGLSEARRLFRELFGARGV